MVQGFCFGLIGVLAAVVHFLTVIVLVGSIRLVPLLANVFAFLVAFVVSYYGHGRFTFASATRRESGALRRFFLVAVFSFVLNESLFYGFLTFTRWHYAVSLFLVLLIVPPITFGLSKWWAFR